MAPASSQMVLGLILLELRVETDPWNPAYTITLMGSGGAQATPIPALPVVGETEATSDERVESASGSD